MSFAAWMRLVPRCPCFAGPVTTVNWEREPGERVEEFVAALLLEHPHGNLITPSRGDRGVDIRVEHPEGFDIYQVKRYAGRLDARQAAEIGKSWSTFVRETLPRLPVRSWTLVTPRNPTNERLDWLTELTTEAEFPCRWMGVPGRDYKCFRPSRRWAKTNPPSTFGAGRCIISASTVKPAASSQAATRCGGRRCT